MISLVFCKIVLGFDDIFKLSKHREELICDSMSDGQCQLLTYQPPLPKGTSYLSELLSLNCMQSARPSFLPEKRGNSHILKNIEEKPQNTNMLKNYGVCRSFNSIELL